MCELGTRSTLGNSDAVLADGHYGDRCGTTWLEHGLAFPAGQPSLARAQLHPNRTLERVGDVEVDLTLVGHVDSADLGWQRPARFWHRGHPGVKRAGSIEHRRSISGVTHDHDEVGAREIDTAAAGCHVRRIA